MFRHHGMDLRLDLCTHCLQAMAELLSEDKVRRWQTLEEQRTFERSGRAAYCPRCSAMCLEADDGSNCAQCPRQAPQTPRSSSLMHLTSDAVVFLQQHCGLSRHSLPSKPVLQTLQASPPKRGLLCIRSHMLLLLLPTVSALMTAPSTSQSCLQSLLPLIRAYVCREGQHT